jgi:hypothetical protein
VIADDNNIWVIIGPFLGTFVALFAAGIAAWPFYQRRQEAQAAHTERVEAACDAVLGHQVDTNTGRPVFVPGLVHVIPLNGYGIEGVPTIKGAIGEAKAAAESAGTEASDAAAAVREALQAHEDREDLHMAAMSGGGFGGDRT